MSILDAVETHADIVIAHRSDLFDIVIGDQCAVTGKSDVKTFGFGVVRNFKMSGRSKGSPRTGSGRVHETA